MVVHVCNPSTEEAEAEEPQVQIQPGLHDKTLSRKEGRKIWREKGRSADGIDEFQKFPSSLKRITYKNHVPSGKGKKQILYCNAVCVCVCVCVCENDSSPSQNIYSESDSWDAEVEGKGPNRTPLLD
jgi:hypothetical protein